MERDGEPLVSRSSKEGAEAGPVEEMGPEDGVAGVDWGFGFEVVDGGGDGPVVLGLVLEETGVGSEDVELTGVAGPVVDATEVGPSVEYGSLWMSRDTKRRGGWKC